MNRQLRRTRLMGIIGLGLIAVGMWWFVLKPGFEAPGEREAQAKALASRMSEQQLIYADLIKKADALPAAAADAKTISTLLPSAAATAELDLSVSNLAQSVGIPSNNVVVQCPDNGGVCALTPLDTGKKAGAPATNGDAAAVTGAGAEATPSPSPTAPANKAAASASVPPLTVYQMKMNIQASGSLEQLTQFVDGLHGISRTLSIQKVTYSPINTKGVSSGVYAVTVEATAFAVQAVLPVPTAPAKAQASATPAPTATPKPTATPAK